MSFSSLGLKPELLQALTEKGYSEPTPIQKQAIPLVLAGRDVMGGAQTGTGKTAGFTLPMLQRLSETGHASGRRHVRALIVTPTRELAAQVHESVLAYGKHLRFKSTVIFGGVSMHNQVQELRRGVDIVVATTGRLLDHTRQRTLDLSKVEIVVLDEADRMLDMGFLPDIHKIAALIPPHRQTLMFSATFSEDIKKLAQLFLKTPAHVQVNPQNAPTELVKQVAHPVDKTRKGDLLVHLITSRNWRQVLVFTRTKAGANKLCKKLRIHNIYAGAIHGNKSQNQRTIALEKFKAGEVQVLVATDLAARGLDIDQLPHVVNYELPNVPEQYVHRIGRTGRAGHEGEAVSLVSVDEAEYLRDIEKLLKKQIPKVLVEGFAPDPNIRGEAAPHIRQAQNAQRRHGGGQRQRHGGGGHGQPKQGGGHGGQPRQQGSGHGQPRQAGSGGGQSGQQRQPGSGGGPKPPSNPWGRIGNKMRRRGKRR